MNRVALEFHPTILRELLGIPSHVKIVGMEWSFEKNCILVYAEAPELPEVQEGFITPHVKMTVKDGKLVWF